MLELSPRAEGDLSTLLGSPLNEGGNPPSEAEDKAFVRRAMEQPPRFPAKVSGLEKSFLSDEGVLKSEAKKRQH